MIKPPSFVKPYTLVFSGDPALDLPVVPADGSDDEKKDAVDRRLVALKNARETGNWPIKAGESPTLFQFAQLNAAGRDHMEAELALARTDPSRSGRFASLVFRLALRRIDNFGDVAVTLSDAGGYQIADESITTYIRDTFGVIGDNLIAEMSQIILQRTFNPDPLS